MMIGPTPTGNNTENRDWLSLEGIFLKCDNIDLGKRMGSVVFVYHGSRGPHGAMFCHLQRNRNGAYSATLNGVSKRCDVYVSRSRNSFIFLYHLQKHVSVFMYVPEQSVRYALYNDTA
jgi:hypothetical protein